MQSSNPALANAFNSYRARYGQQQVNTDLMTVNGSIAKTVLLILLVILSAGWTWVQFFESKGNIDTVTPWMYGGALVGFVLAMATIFKQSWAPITAPLYALAEGFFIGGISALMESSFPGIVIQATLLTFGTLLAMLLAYRTGLIRATEKFKLGIVAATGGIALVYLATIILGLFNVSVPFIYGSGAIGIGFSLFVVVIAALNFVIDFDVIEQGAERGAPKYMEWYGAFGLMVTLIWLYIEFLRLLAKLKER